MAPGRAAVSMPRREALRTRRALLLESAGLAALLGGFAWWRSEPERLVGLACYSAGSTGACHGCCDRLPRLPGGAPLAVQACHDRCASIVGLPGSKAR